MDEYEVRRSTKREREAYIQGAKDAADQMVVLSHEHPFVERLAAELLVSIEEAEWPPKGEA